MKNGRSLTPCTCALSPLIFELNDSAEALVDLLLKSFRIYSSFPLIVSRTEMITLMRVFPTFLYHLWGPYIFFLMFTVTKVQFYFEIYWVLLRKVSKLRKHCRKVPHAPRHFPKHKRQKNKTYRR